MQLKAITNMKYGQKKNEDGTIEILAAAPGETFDIDDATAKALIERGVAATPEDYDRAKAAAVPSDERMATLEVENAQLRADMSSSAAARAQLEVENADLKAQVEAKGKRS